MSSHSTGRVIAFIAGFGAALLIVFVAKQTSVTGRAVGGQAPAAAPPDVVVAMPAEEAKPSTDAIVRVVSSPYGTTFVAGADPTPFVDTLRFSEPVTAASATGVVHLQLSAFGAPPDPKAIHSIDMGGPNVRFLDRNTTMEITLPKVKCPINVAVVIPEGSLLGPAGKPVAHGPARHSTVMCPPDSAPQ